MMSTEHDYTVGSPQRAWLEADLKRAAANRDMVPWLILVGHRPMYCTDDAEKDAHWPGAPFQQEIEPLMVQCVAVGCRDVMGVVCWAASDIVFLS
jgi:hypothetical protein